MCVPENNGAEIKVGVQEFKIVQQCMKLHTNVILVALFTSKSTTFTVRKKLSGPRDFHLKTFRIKHVNCAIDKFAIM